MLLYLFQEGEVSVMNRFPYLSGEKILLNGGHPISSPGTLVFVRPYDLHRLPPLWLSKLREEAEGWEHLQDAIKRIHGNSRCHPSHLCKRYFGLTPAEYRRTMH